MVVTIKIQLTPNLTCFLLQHTITKHLLFHLLVQKNVLGEILGEKKITEKTNYKSTFFLKIFCALTSLGVTKTQDIKTFI